jgi:hypothetical protein
MFAPCVTTRRIPLPVNLSMTARAGDQGLSLIAQHDHIAKCRLGFDRSQLQQRCRRHHGELRILSTAIPTDLSRAPILAASARSLALRLR